LGETPCAVCFRDRGGAPMGGAPRGVGANRGWPPRPWRTFWRPPPPMYSRAASRVLRLRYGAASEAGNHPLGKRDCREGLMTTSSSDMTSSAACFAFGTSRVVGVLRQRRAVEDRSFALWRHAVGKIAMDIPIADHVLSHARAPAADCRSVQKKFASQPGAGDQCGKAPPCWTHRGICHRADPSKGLPARRAPIIQEEDSRLHHVRGHPGAPRKQLSGALPHLRGSARSRNTCRSRTRNVDLKGHARQTRRRSDVRAAGAHI